MSGPLDICVIVCLFLPKPNYVQDGGDFDYFHALDRMSEGNDHVKLFALNYF